MAIPPLILIPLHYTTQNFNVNDKIYRFRPQFFQIFLIILYFFAHISRFFLQLLPQPPQGALFDAGYIAAADA